MKDLFRYYITIMQKMFFISVSVLLISCEEEIPLELNESKFVRVVVEGRITNEFKTHQVRLTKTISYFKNEEVPPLLNAEVYITETSGGARYDLALVDSALGIYQTPQFKGKVGDSYSLFVNDGTDIFKATTYLDTVTKMDSIRYKYEYDNYMKYGYYKISMSAFEPPPVGNIYMFYIYLNDTLMNDKISEPIYQNDDFFNNIYLADIEIYKLRQERVKLDTNRVRLEMLSISKEELNFMNSFMAEYYGNGSIFSGPPANISSNLKNTTGDLDGLGFFGASSITAMEMTLIKQHDESTNDPDYKPD
jgi:hypothetical protein